MTRRNFVRSLILVAVGFVGAACAGNSESQAPRAAAGEPEAANGAAKATAPDRLEKSRKEWREILEPDRYKVLFEEDTEPPYSSPLNLEKRKGTFVCAACGLPLFESDTKFSSGTGWPSFTSPIERHIATKVDYKLLFPRTEYHCARCGGHQGHVFEDGPPPTGQRWCNNGVALEFVPEGEPLPELRQ